MFNPFRPQCLAPLVLLFLCAQAPAAPVDINNADAATLARELKGVGNAKANTIVEYRRTHGGFKTIDDLALVKGIGAKLVERNRPDLRLGHFTPGSAANVTATPAGAAGVRTVVVKPAPADAAAKVKTDSAGKAAK